MSRRLPRNVCLYQTMGNGFAQDNSVLLWPHKMSHTYIKTNIHTYIHTYTHTYIYIYIHTYILTPWSRVLLEKLSGSAASQEITRLFGTRRFLTVPTSARHLSLSWANSIQFPQLPPTSWRSILVLSSLYLRIVLSPEEASRLVGIS